MTYRVEVVEMDRKIYYVDDVDSPEDAIIAVAEDPDHNYLYMTLFDGMKVISVEEDGKPETKQVFENYILK